MHLDRLVYVAFAFAQLMDSFVLYDGVFCVRGEIQCLRAKEMEHGKRTEMVTFLSRRHIFIK